MPRGPMARDRYGLTGAQRAAFMQWLMCGNVHATEWNAATISKAKVQLGFDGMNPIECLPRVLSRMPDLIDPESELGRVLTRILRRAS